MRKSWPILLGLAVMFALVLAVRADEEKTLKGTITCAKCGLKEADACHTVIQVKEDDKDVTYYFDKSSTDYKKTHKEICQEAKKGSVTGKVSEKDGKKYIKVTKVEFD
jgi:hypothetical protein